MNNTQHTKQWAIKTLVPEEVYTDRAFFLDYFYNAALKARTRRTMSTVLLGQRRMGKTEIFKRVVNRLFFEQDHLDPQAVVPVYYSFPDFFKDRWDFAEKYVKNFIRWYAAFRLRDPSILWEEKLDREELVALIRHKMTMSEGLEGSLHLLGSFLKKTVTAPEEVALQHPRWVADHDDSTIVVFLDEFQNLRLPQYDFDVVGYMQEAVESLTCPHFVTGSAMSILAREILGRGSLFGRFRSKPIEPLTVYFGAELTQKSAQYYKTEVSQEMAPIVAARCGGNPFYINAVVQQAAEQEKAILNEESLNTILSVDLSSGFIWNELSDQVNRWIERINEYKITKWILYLSAVQEGDRIDLSRIQQQLLAKEGKQVSLEQIREVLIKLSRGDLIDYKELGGWFRKVNDPILLEFLKVWGKIEVEGINSGDVQDELQQQYQTLQKRVRDLKGYLAEVYMAQILLNAQRQNLPGQYLHTDNDVFIPDFNYVRLRERLGPGKGAEIDVHAAAGIEQWVAESKWQQGRKAGLSEIQKLLDKASMVIRNRETDFVRVWFFSYDGFTNEAEEFMEEQGIFWSTHADLDHLLDYVKLRCLPTL